MAFCISSDSGSTSEANLAMMLPSRPIRNFSKFHCTAPEKGGLLSFAVRNLKADGVLAFQGDLGEHVELDLVIVGAELLDLRLGPRFLAAEIVAGKAEHGQADLAYLACRACNP